MAELPIEKKIHGHVVYGGGEAVYFIPDDQLEQFRVPEELAEDARSAADGSAEVAGFTFDRESALGNLPTTRVMAPVEAQWTLEGWHTNSMTTKSVVAFTATSA